MDLSSSHWSRGEGETPWSRLDPSGQRKPTSHLSETRESFAKSKPVPATPPLDLIFQVWTIWEMQVRHLEIGLSSPLTFLSRWSGVKENFKHQYGEKIDNIRPAVKGVGLEGWRNSCVWIWAFSLMHDPLPGPASSLRHGDSVRKCNTWWELWVATLCLTTAKYFVVHLKVEERKKIRESRFHLGMVANLTKVYSNLPTWAMSL